MTAQTIFSTSEREAAEAPSVLLVEDEPTLQTVLRRSLEARQYRVRAVATGRAAVDAVKASAPDVMLLDINLPDGSGWDVLRELQACDVPHVPTVVVSAVRCSQARLEEFHPEAYLPKPFPLAALLETVERLTETGVDERGEGGDEAGDRGGGSQDVHFESPAAATTPPPAVRQPMSHAYAQALCDLIEDEHNGITGIRVVGARARTVYRLEALARERGLSTESGECRDDRRWVRITGASPAEPEQK